LYSTFNVDIPGGLGAYLAEMLDCPIIHVLPAGPVHFLTSLLGSPFNPAYQPVLTGKMTDPTEFSQRLGKHFFSYLQFFPL
jgi:hypothetical protein